MIVKKNLICIITIFIIIFIIIIILQILLATRSLRNQGLASLSRCVALLTLIWKLSMASRKSSRNTDFNKFCSYY